MKPSFEPGVVRRIGGRVLDLLYPSVCAVCDEVLRGSRYLCDDCERQLPKLRAPFCESCGEMFDGKIGGSFSCPNCQGLTFAFEFARPAMVRDERTLEMVHRLKYGRNVYLGRELGRLAAGAFEDERLTAALSGKWPLIPVPLHRSRLRWRHFNQSEEIARGIARETGLEVLRGMKRVRNTETQTRLSRRQRLENLRGAFELSWRGRRWLDRRPGGAVLVDDVFTTGSTANECAKTLRKAGLKRVVVVTVMRG
ncbi:MAG: ComF family protein [Verrucomicrobiales bacterium]|nr:ComF family protein [Verrucomicrobiota bacterium JB025]